MPDQGPAALLAALPNYAGGKRKLATVIFRAIAATHDGPPTGATLIDPFMGGGSISALGKLRGYRVLANDVSPRSEAIGKALVENSRVQLDESDVRLALATDAAGWFMPPVNHLLWPDDAREVVAGIAKAAESYEQPEKRWLLRALAVKTALGISRWGQPRMSVGRKARDKRYDEMTPAQARALHYLTMPRKVALAQAKTMYGVVSSNGRDNRVERMDVLEFLRGVDGDVAYLDPPYPATMSYENAYVGIDEVLENTPLDGAPSRFSASDGWRFLGDVFDAAEHIPAWVLSLGNEAVDIDTLAGMMRERGREVDAQAVSYAHMRSLATTEKTAGNEEFLLVGRAR